MKSNNNKYTMRVFKNIVLLSFIIVAFSCSTNRKVAENIQVAKLSGSTPIREGSIVYGLPRTVFNVVVTMERTIEIPGPYWQFAGDLLGLDNVIKNNNEIWTIDGVSVESREELDPSQFYVVESNSLLETNVLSLRNEGLIMDLDPAIYYSAGKKDGVERSENNRFVSADLGSDEYFQVQRDTAFKRIKVDSTFIRVPYIVEKRKKLADEQLAERAAKRLMEMRDGKHLILTGEANVFPQSEAVINEMNRMEREYTELFTGKRFTERRTFTFQVIPTADMAGKPFRLFQFSELTGPVADNKQGGDPVMIELVPEKRTQDLNIINKPDTKTNEEQRFDRLYYRVPDVVNMKISLENEPLFSSRRLVYQYGKVIQLPANLIIGK
jgi:hypothetical protein